MRTFQETLRVEKLRQEWVNHAAQGRRERSINTWERSPHQKVEKCRNLRGWHVRDPLRCSLRRRVLEQCQIHALPGPDTRRMIRRGPDNLRLQEGMPNSSVLDTGDDNTMRFLNQPCSACASIFICLVPGADSRAVKGVRAFYRVVWHGLVGLLKVLSQ